MLCDPKLNMGDLEEAGHEHLKLVGFQESEDDDHDAGGGDVLEDEKEKILLMKRRLSTCSGPWAHL